MSAISREQLSFPVDGTETEWYTFRETLEAIAASPGDVRLALSISGGGATGAFQAGVLKALADAIASLRAEYRVAAERVTPQIVVGTSAGSLHAFRWLIDRLELAHPMLRNDPVEHLSASLWRTIGAHDDGASFVVGKGRRLLTRLLTKYSRPPLGAWLPTIAGVSSFAAILGIGALARVPRGYLVKTLPAAGLAAAIVAAGHRYRRSIFANDFLRSTLTNTIRGRDDAASDGTPQSARERLLRAIDAQRESEAGLCIVQSWGGGPRDLELIVTATDLTAGRDVENRRR